MLKAVSCNVLTFILNDIIREWDNIQWNGLCLGEKYKNGTYTMHAYVNMEVTVITQKYDMGLFVRKCMHGRRVRQRQRSNDLACMFVWIGTIYGMPYANLKSQLCTTILRLAAQLLDFIQPHCAKCGLTNRKSLHYLSHSLLSWPQESVQGVD